jgi:hypothetical protein
MATSSTDRTFDGRVPGSRRTFMTGCALLAATAGLGPRPDRGAVANDVPPELFAFAAPAREEFVFALALPLAPFRSYRRAPLGVRLLAGEFCWTIRPPALGRHIEVLLDGTRLFSGKVRRTDRGEKTSHLFGVAIPGRRIRRSVGMWAEILDAGGARSRVGHPLVSKLLSGNDDLARIHGATDPATDRRFMLDGIARGIAACRGALGHISGQACGERFADLLLPDVLWFDPARPGGFTFAARNGRRPGDLVDHVIETLLAGAPRHEPHAAAYQASSEFPYFSGTDIV